MGLDRTAAAIAAAAWLAAVSCGAVRERQPAQQGGRAMTLEYTGREVGLESAIGSGADIVLGRLTRSGAGSPAALGQQYFDGASLEVIRWLRAGREEDRGGRSLEFAYTQQVLPAAAAEQAPVVGQTYLFFLARRSDGTLRAIKILAADDPRIAEVERKIGKL